MFTFGWSLDLCLYLQFLSFPGIGSQDLKLETSYVLSRCFFFPSHKNDHSPGVQIGVRKRGTAEVSDQQGDCKRYSWRKPCPSSEDKSHRFFPWLQFHWGQTVFPLFFLRCMAWGNLSTIDKCLFSMQLKPSTYI